MVEFCGGLLLTGLLVPLVLWFGLLGAILATGVWLAIRLTGNLIILRKFAGVEEKNSRKTLLRDRFEDRLGS
jgi:hypothetical protein